VFLDLDDPPFMAFQAIERPSGLCKLSLVQLPGAFLANETFWVIECLFVDVYDLFTDPQLACAAPVKASLAER